MNHIEHRKLAKDKLVGKHAEVLNHKHDKQQGRLHAHGDTADALAISRHDEIHSEVPVQVMVRERGREWYC